jgi:uncharacterized protein
MLFGVADGGALELRREENGGVRLRGRFPYGSETSLAPGRSERFAARAFAARIDAGADIHLLSGHDYEKPLASRAAGTLTLRDTPQALELDATVTAEMANTTWARDFLLAQGAGLELSAVTVPAYRAAQIEARNWKAEREAPDMGLMRTLNRWRA